MAAMNRNWQFAPAPAKLGAVTGVAHRRRGERRGARSATAAASRPLPPARCISARWSRRSRAIATRARRAANGCVRIEDVDLPRARARRRARDPARRSSATASRGTGRWCANRSAPRSTRRRSSDCVAAATSTPAPARGASSRARRSAPAASASIRAPAATAFPPDRAQRSAARVARARRRRARSTFRDRLQGAQAQDLARDVGDFVVRRADGLFAYQLAVVVDDAAQGITDVVRGADLLASTPRQILLQRRLGYADAVVSARADRDRRAPARSCRSRRARRRCPATPLPALVAAWRFLDQPLPAGSRRAGDASREFWAVRRSRAWNPARLPPVPMLPAPRAFRPDAPARV